MERVETDMRLSDQSRSEGKLDRANADQFLNGPLATEREWCRECAECVAYINSVVSVVSQSVTDLRSSVYRTPRPQLF